MKRLLVCLLVIASCRMQATIEDDGLVSICTFRSGRSIAIDPRDVFDAWSGTSGLSFKFRDSYSGELMIYDSSWDEMMDEPCRRVPRELPAAAPAAGRSA